MRERGSEGGREGGREGGKEEVREGGREGMRERGSEGGRTRMHLLCHIQKPDSSAVDNYCITSTTSAAAVAIPFPTSHHPSSLTSPPLHTPGTVVAGHHGLALPVPLSDTLPVVESSVHTHCRLLWWGRGQQATSGGALRWGEEVRNGVM